MARAPFIRSRFRWTDFEIRFALAPPCPPANDARAFNDPQSPNNFLGVRMAGDGRGFAVCSRAFRCTSGLRPAWGPPPLRENRFITRRRGPNILDFGWAAFLGARADPAAVSAQQLALIAKAFIRAPSAMTGAFVQAMISVSFQRQLPAAGPTRLVRDRSRCVRLGPSHQPFPSFRRVEAKPAAMRRDETDSSLTDIPRLLAFLPTSPTCRAAFATYPH